MLYITHYIFDTTIMFKMYNKHKKKIGYVSFIIIPDYVSALRNGKIIIKTKTCHIQFLVISKEYQGNGYGTYLLKKVFNYCKDKNVSSIYLDDCSDRCFMDKNIYVNNGFHYKSIDKSNGMMIRRMI